MVGTKIPSDFLSVFQDFCKTTLQQDLNFDRLLLQGAYLYQAVPVSPDLTQLHAIHSGWWLGAYKRSQRGGTLRFEPAHALALGLQSNQVQRAISLDLTAAVHYLQGEPISDPGPDGWMLVCVDSHPLGWGKRSAGIIKNYYPKGLRWK